MITNAFVNQLNDTPVEREDATNLDQCFDLAFAWVDYLNIPRSAIRHLYAYQIWALANTETRQYFDLAGTGQNGDLMVYGQSVGKAGHVCLYLREYAPGKPETFDQNWNGVLRAEVVKKPGYYGVIGFLRPKQLKGEDMGRMEEVEKMANDRQARLDRVGGAVSVPGPIDGNNIEQVLANIHQLYVLVDEKDKQIAELNAQPVGEFVPVTEQLFKKK